MFFPTIFPRLLGCVITTVFYGNYNHEAFVSGGINTRRKEPRLDVFSRQSTLAGYIPLQKYDTFFSTNMKANSMTFLLVLMAAVLLASSKPTNIGETDIVTEIVRAMEAREEMWRVVSYLKASRDGLLKEFPLFTAGKPNIIVFAHLMWPQLFSIRWNTTKLHFLCSDVVCFHVANSARYGRSALCRWRPPSQSSDSSFRTLTCLF